METTYFTNCSGFCHTLTWITHGRTRVPHPEHPSRHPLCPIPSAWSQRTSPERLVAFIALGLAIYFTYGKLHISMLFSQIIPPSPSRTESKILFLASMSLLLFFFLTYFTVYNRLQINSQEQYTRHDGFFQPAFYGRSIVFHRLCQYPHQ